MKIWGSDGSRRWVEGMGGGGGGGKRRRGRSRINIAVSRTRTDQEKLWSGVCQCQEADPANAKPAPGQDRGAARRQAAVSRAAQNAPEGEETRGERGERGCEP